MSLGYRKSHLDPDKGHSYQREFSRNRYRAVVWELEQQILHRIVSEFCSGQEITHLDFACGTGRILKLFEDKCLTSVGVDVSASMLEVAREECRRAVIIKGDLTREDLLESRRFSLVTAFRFFPNAEPALRREAMRILTRHLSESGYLVFNNHKNTGSTRNRLARLFGRRGYKGMSFAETKALLAENDLKILKTYHLCVFPASEQHMLLSEVPLRHIERFLMRIPILRNFGENLVFVCKHAGNEWTRS